MIMREKIAESFLDCGKDGIFADAAEALLKTLGYEGDRIFELSGSPKEFFEETIKEVPDTKSAKRFLQDVESVNMLFQFGGDEIKKAIEEAAGTLGFDFGKGRFNKREFDSFLFFAVELKEKTYRRSDYASFTREINKVFNIPSVVLFRCGNVEERRITLSFVWRRTHKTKAERDVLGRVSLLREIVCKDAHRGHVNILEQLTLKNRFNWMKQNRAEKFEGLLAAWLDELDAEALNRRFYLDLRAWFDRAIKKAKFPIGKVTVQQQVVRMISRLLFIWFMKEKKLVCDDLFDEERMREVLANYDPKGDSYYRAILQNLFFATLNTEIDKREFSSVSQKTHRDSSLYRYKNLMKKPKDVLGMMKETPFVNGGLFDCLDDFEAVGKGGERIDCFTDNPAQRKQLCVPNSLFFGKEGVFEIFRKYKFTVEENTPIEQEVALDPELLGKVFENLLVYVETRRETGSFYTPRIIVDYMVRESLAAYFVRTMETDNKNLHKIIRRLLSAEVAYETLPESEKLNESESEQFVMAAGKLRLLDPAVGSGAFPIGALQQMTMALLRVDPENEFLKKWELEVANKHSDSGIRGDSIALVKDAFSKDNQYNNYGRKLSLIRNCLFGVDIQPIAVQICRLRFFISLLIEQEINSTKDNFGIRPLPNMDAKIIAADTLSKLGGESRQYNLSGKEVEKKLKKISDIRNRFFSARTRQEKIEYIHEDEKARMDLADFLVKSLYPAKDAQKIAGWNLYDQNTVADWFDPTWMFNFNNGFDIIIGNPPYIQLQADGGRLADLYAPNKYETFSRSGDIYCLFYERAVELLCNGGRFCYITSNKFMRAQYGKGLRQFLSCSTELQKIIDFGELPVFEAGADTSIVMGNNMSAKSKTRFFAATIKKTSELYQLPDAVDALGSFMDQKLLSEDGWVLVQEDVLLLINKMCRIGISLNGYVNKQEVVVNSRKRRQACWRGITSGLDEAFIINREQRQEILDRDCASAELIKPYLLSGREIKKWYAQREGWYIIYTDRNTQINKYPGAKAHLLQYKESLEGRASPGSEYWYALQAPTDFSGRVASPKIVYGRLSKELYAFIDNDGLYVNSNAVVVFSDDNEYLLGIMNSDLLDFYYRHVFPSWGDPWNDGRIQFRGVRMEQIPIMDASPAQRREISSRVKKILADPRGKQVAKLETEIDELVYALYELTKEEIALVKKWQSSRIS